MYSVQIMWLKIKEDTGTEVEGGGERGSSMLKWKRRREAGRCLTAAAVMVGGGGAGRWIAVASVIETLLLDSGVNYFERWLAGWTGWVVVSHTQARV